MKNPLNPLLMGVALVLSLTPGVSARTMRHASHRVAYDAKDKRYYSVAWARAHGMRDRGGDPLTILPMSSLPKNAKMSRAMHGKMP